MMIHIEFDTAPTDRPILVLTESGEWIRMWLDHEATFWTGERAWTTREGEPSVDEAELYGWMLMTGGVK